MDLPPDPYDDLNEEKQNLDLDELNNGNSISNNEAKAKRNRYDDQGDEQKD